MTKRNFRANKCKKQENGQEKTQKNKPSNPK
jgi:hypothetical protein